MDKKKVKELALDTLTSIKEAISSTDDVILSLTLANIASKIALIGVEVNKSDWVSVEDGLPEYGEEVFAYDKEMKDYPFVTMRYHGGKEKLIDTNGFRSGLHVTHWKPIEKLED